MRIGIDFRMAGTKHGGIGRYVLELVKNLVKIDNQNEYFLFHNQDGIDKLECQFTTHYSLPTIHYIPVNVRHYSVAEQVFFPKILSKYNLDIVHFPNFNVPLLYKQPFIVTIHDIIHHKLGNVKKRNWLYFWAYKKIIKSAVQNSKKIITVSEGSKSDIINEFNIPEEKVVVIYEGSTEAKTSLPKVINEFKKKYLLDKPFFLFVGVKQRNKNLPMLCKAFGRFVKESGLDFDLVIAGRTDPHYPDITQDCLSLSENLVFIEHFNDEDLEILYHQATAFVSASLFEGFGLPGLEAMSRGLPLAVSNIPVFNEIYESGAIYFDPNSPESIAECLKLLAQDRLYYMQLREKALKRSREFSWEKCAKETLKVYSDI